MYVIVNDRKVQLKNGIAIIEHTLDFFCRQVQKKAKGTEQYLDKLSKYYSGRVLYVMDESKEYIEINCESGVITLHASSVTSIAQYEVLNGLVYILDIIMDNKLTDNVNFTIIPLAVNIFMMELEGDKIKITLPRSRSRIKDILSEFLVKLY